MSESEKHSVEPPSGNPFKLDSGWAWIILFSGTILGTLSISMSTSFGIIFNEFLIQRSVEASLIPSVNTLSVAISSLGVFFSGPISKTLRLRPTSVFCSLMMFIGLTATSQVQNVGQFVASYSLLFCFFAGVSYGLSFLVVNQYFDKRRGLAMSVFNAGSALGRISLPAGSAFLASELGDAGALLVLAGVWAHGIPAAMTFRPVNDARNDANGVEAAAAVAAGGKREGMMHDDAGLITDDTKLSNSHAESSEGVVTTATAAVARGASVVTELGMSRARGNHRSPLLKSTSCTRQAMDAFKSIPEFFTQIISNIDYKLLRVPMAALITFSECCIWTGLNNFCFILAVELSECGKSKTEISAVLSVFPAADLCARLTTPLFVDKKWTRGKHGYLFGIVLASVGCLGKRLMAFLRILVLLIVGVAAAGADCSPEDGAFLCRDICGEEVRGAGGYGRRVTFVGATLFLDCVRQADLKEVKLLSPTVCVGRTRTTQRRNDFLSNEIMAFLKMLVLLIVGVVAAGADCGPEGGAFLCRDVCGEEVRGAGGYGRRVTFVGATLFLDCVRQADLKEVKLLSPTVCVGRRSEMERVVTPWRWCEEVVPPEPEVSTAAVPPVVDEPRPVAPTANLAVVHVPASKTPFVARAPPSTQQSVVVAPEVPYVIRAPSSTPEVTVNIKHGVAHVEADVDPWTAMVLVFMGLGGAGATTLAVFLVWLVKFIRNKSSYMRELVRMLTPEDQQDPEAQPVEDLLGLEEADNTVAEKKEEELEVKLLSPTVCVGRRSEMERVVTPWRWCEEVVPPEPEVSTAAVPPVVDEPRPVAPTANLAVVHVPASKTPFVVRAPPSTQQSVVVAPEVPYVIRAPSSTPEVTVNIKHGVAHVEADVDPWTAMVLVFMGLGGAGATTLAVFLVWLVKFIRNKDPEAQPVEDLLGLEEADKTVEEKKEEQLVLEDNNPFKEMLNA
ncbi:unnamed protein product [Notodromas monacha]|uniref:Uncharacterized protein n=1 Tax=Notodromas monacha TaxID=399045 RepID=A0A7R9GAK6_9CRUS|nr:unnamed protein product [Notodromas monacha]CAG0914105.1 unnamed protein product [Notodromas monacha]